MRQSQEDLMWQEAAARQEKQEQKYRDEIAALRQRAEAAEAQLEAIPVDALLAIEEIAPLVGHDVIGNPETWMKAWDEVSPWLATLEPTPHPENPWMYGEVG